MTTPPAAAVAGNESPEALALKHAFLRGAGIAPEAISAELTPELMELIGKLLANSLQSSIEQLAMRSLVKQEVHADQTMVLVRNNNPLKFFPDSQTVLTQMLRKKMPGFMEPLEAVADARHDLRGHQLGVVAGASASVRALMERVEPARLEASQPAPGLLDKLAPSRRQAALWQQFVQEYGVIAGESHDQFKTVFGPAFLKAYEEEVARFNDEARNA